MNWTQLVSGHLENLIDKDENKGLQQSGTVFTGTNSDGSTVAELTCNDWSYDDSVCNSAAYSGAAGTTTVSTAPWTYNTQYPCCGSGLQLYCIEQ